MSLYGALVLLVLLPSVAWAMAWEFGYHEGKTDARLEFEAEQEEADRRLEVPV